jgi:hypothetical protein
VKLSLKALSIPKPTIPDLIAATIAIVGGVVALIFWNLANSRGAGDAFPTDQAIGFALLELGICFASLLILGVTAKRGTILGNLASLAGMMIGISAGLLAAALWVLA